MPLAVCIRDEVDKFSRGPQVSFWAEFVVVWEVLWIPVHGPKAPSAWSSEIKFAARHLPDVKDYKSALNIALASMFETLTMYTCLSE